MIGRHFAPKARVKVLGSLSWWQALRFAVCTLLCGASAGAESTLEEIDKSPVAHILRYL